MTSRSTIGGSRYLYAPFDAATARIEANERVLEEKWQAMNYRLVAMEAALERLERRLWLAVYGVLAVILAEAFTQLLDISSAF
jgi:hypothetical protein